MAQFYVDPTTFDIADWTVRSGTPGDVVLGVATDEGADSIRANWTGGAEDVAVSYDPAGTSQDVDILTMSATDDSGGNRAGLAGRINGQNFYETIKFQSNIYIGRMGNNRSFLANTGTINKATYYYERFQIIGSTIRVRRWAGGIGDEPLAWDLEVTDAELTAAGYAGIAFRGDGPDFYRFIGIGTNGDPAPTGPVSPGTSDDLTADSLQSQSEVSTPPIGQVHALSAVSLESDAEVTTPSLEYVAGTDELAADSLQSQAEISTPAIGQVHALSASGLESDSSISTPQLSEAFEGELDPEDLEARSELSTPAVGQVHNLAARDLESDAEISRPSLEYVAGTDELQADDLEASSELSRPTIGQVHALVPRGLESDGEISVPALGQVHALAAGGLESLSVLSSPTLRNPNQLLVRPIRNTRVLWTQAHYTIKDATPTRSLRFIE